MPDNPSHGPGENRGRPAVDSLGTKLLRLLVGISLAELNDAQRADRAIRRTVRMMAAYTIVAGVVVFFLSIPSFIDHDGSLHTANFSTFLWIGSPFFDCVALLVLSLYLGQSKNLLVGLGLVGVSGFQTYMYTQRDSMIDIVMLIACLMIALHALQIVGLLVFGRSVRAAD